MKILIILGRLLFALLFLTPLFGEVSVNVDKAEFNQGDEVTLQFKVVGNNLEIPKIDSILEFKIVHSRKSEQNIENDLKMTILEYTFIPNRTLEIPSYLFKIDNKSYKTNPIELKKNPLKVSQENDNLQYKLEVSKNKVFINEPIIATLTFKYNRSIEILKNESEPFFGNDFIVRELPLVAPFEEKDFINHSSKYLLIPKVKGEVTIQNQLINVKVQEGKFQKARYKVFSDIQKIIIQELPKGINYQGEYTIKATVDTTETTKDSPINLTLQIEGFGNIDEIAPFSLVLPNQLVFSAKPTIQTYLGDGKYGGVFTQKISISSEEDFVIPSFKLEYFDGITKSLKQITTKPIKITVKGDEEVENTSPSAIKEIKTITKEKTTIEEKKGFHMEYIDWILGFLMGCVATYFVLQKTPKKRQRGELSLEEKIKRAKKDKELFDILLPYSQNPRIAIFIKRLEGNIYLNQKNKIDKKALLEVFNPLKDEDEVF